LRVYLRGIALRPQVRRPGPSPLGRFKPITNMLSGVKSAF
jgi:hypothetical protein